MALNRLQRDFEDRRQNLIDTLQRGKDSLDLSKQHQIYGAIKEIDNFLKAIEYQRELQQSGDDFELMRDEPKVGRARQAFVTFGQTIHSKVFAPASKLFKRNKQEAKALSKAETLQPPQDPNGQ